MESAVRSARAPVMLLAGLLLSLIVPLTPAAAAEDHLPGIDVSHWQGQIDWAAVKADGVRFAVVKATEGRTFVDNRYAANHSAAEAVQLPVGAYHYAQPDKTAGDAVAEADHFVDTAQLKGRNLLPVLDLEEHNGLGPRKLRQWVRAWLERVEQRLRVKALIYTSPSFWRDYMGDSGWFANNGYRLWIAHWNATEPSVPAANWGGRGWTLWQHSAKGSVAGISGDVDLDRYKGTRPKALKIKNNR